MKKISLYLIIIIFILINIPIVKAYDNEYLGNVALQTDFNSEVSGFALNTTTTSDGGYLTAVDNYGLVKTDSSGTIIWSATDYHIIDAIETSSGKIIGVTSENAYLYNSSGELQKEITFSESLGFPGGRNIFKFGDNYAIIGLAGKYYSTDNSNIIITIIDKDGNEVDNTKIEIIKVELPDSDSDVCGDTGSFYLGSCSNVVGSYYGATIAENTIYLFASNNGNMELITVNENLEITKTILDTSSLSDSALNNIRYGAFTSLAIKDNDVYFATSYGIFKITNNKIEEKLISSESGITGLDLTSMAIYNNKIIVGGLSTGESNNALATVVIYDLDFNLLDTISLNEIFNKTTTLNIVKDVKIQNNKLIIGGMFSDIDDQNEDLTYSTMERAFLLVYDLIYDIETETDGHGIILSSLTTASSGESITFTITPEEGYVLDSVKVVDSNGNVIEYISNTFTMPASNITIKATFVPVNPETNDIINLLIILFISIGICFTIFKLKLHKLN